MKPKFCTCSSREPDGCKVGLKLGGPCVCACHGAERRPPVEVRADLMERLKGRVKFVPTDIASDPNALVAFTLQDEVGQHKSEIVVEYQAGEGFGLTLVGWCEDEDRTYKIDNLVKKIEYWLDGYI